MTWWGRDMQMPVDVVTGCFMLVRKEAIEQVGLMDEQYFMYGEETDWCWRFKKAGWQIMFSPVGRIIHLGGQSARKQPGPMLLQLKGSILLFLKKNRSLLEYWGCCLLTALYFAVRLPAWAIMAIIKPAQDSTKMRCYYYAKGIFYSLRGASALCVGKEPS
jgi:GT2 family glycosyltransferase